MREETGLIYKVTLHRAGAVLFDIKAAPKDETEERSIRKKLEQAQEALKEPWELQVRRRRRKSGPHVNGELLRLWRQKKKRYDRWCWKPTEQNKKTYKAACQRAQRRERKLIKEQESRFRQRIQVDPESEIAKALRTSAQRRQAQSQLDKASGKQLRPREFAQYLSTKLDGPKEGLTVLPFEVNEGEFKIDAIAAIKDMDCNKAIGTDGVHVEMCKSNPEAAAELLTRMWSTIGKSTVVPRDWLRGIVVPLYKGKGSQKEPVNFRPLCILSHMRKLVEKAVVAKLDRQFETDIAQYGFQAGIQTTQAALSVLAAIAKKRAKFVVVLDLAKAYDTVHKRLIQKKLFNEVDDNLARQLTIFLLTVTAQVTGDISQTSIQMLRGLTQGGTSSPALFNSLPEEVRQGLEAANQAQAGLDPLRLVADDVLGLTKTVEGLQVLLDICKKWADVNELEWNPTKSQVLLLDTTIPRSTVQVVLGDTQLKVTDMVEYLGMRLSKDGFLGKDPTELLSKATAALHMLTSEPWFSLALPPKHIARAFQTYVRSVTTYGAELLSSRDRFALEELYGKLVTKLLNKLLDLGRERGKLAEKHRWRLQLALGIPTMQMDLDSLLANRVDAWLERRTSDSTKIASHANESLQNITCLHEDHPLRQELNRHTPSLHEARKTRRARAWSNLLSASKGTSAGSGVRQILAQATGLSDEGEGTGTGESVIDDRDVAPELKKAALRWSVYRFPVRHIPTDAEDRLLKKLPTWARQSKEEKTRIRGALFDVYNAEQRCWNMKTIANAGAEDIRSQPGPGSAGPEARRATQGAGREV